MLTQVVHPKTDDNQIRTDIESGQRVLQTESEALKALGESLDEDFARAVALFGKVTGRIIVSGMGKSGHIGRKIAATFASTGAPSQFVHPGEASHGDLGMITEADAILAISNSGETKELSDLLLYSRRFSIPLVAITSVRESTLADKADIPLILPKRREASIVGLAPTTSTTMTLALGDALAVALLERKGFSARDFHDLHPGGKLGRQLMRIKDLMHCGTEIPVASQDCTMRDAILIMAEKRFGCIGVLDGQGALIGIVTDGDLRRHMSNDLLNKTLYEVMTPSPITTTGDALAMEVMGQMNDAKIGAIFVVADDKPVGIAHLHDFLHAGIA